MNSDTLLLRQIHASWIEGGEATSQAFTPTSKDDGRLSVDDGDQITPGAAWGTYTRQGHQSEGVMAVTVAEVHQRSLSVAPAPTPERPEHALIDFTSVSRSRAKRIGKKLSERANERRWLYKP